MHTMQENDVTGSGDDAHGNEYLEVSLERGQSREVPEKNVQLIGAAVVGMLLPVITQIGHAH